MRFVPVLYESPQEFLDARWSNGGEGLTVLNRLDEFVVGDEVILEIKVRGASEQTVVRGTVVWRREREDPLHRLPAGVGVRIEERDLDKLTVLSRQMGDVRKA